MEVMRIRPAEVLNYAPKATSVTSCLTAVFKLCNSEFSSTAGRSEMGGAIAESNSKILSQILYFYIL